MSHYKQKTSSDEESFYIPNETKNRNKKDKVCNPEPRVKEVCNPSTQSVNNGKETEASIDMPAPKTCKVAHESLLNEENTETNN